MHVLHYQAQLHPNIYSELVHPQVWITYSYLSLNYGLLEILPIFLIDSLTSIYGHYSIVSLSLNTLIPFYSILGLLRPAPFLSVSIETNMCFCNDNQLGQLSCADFNFIRPNFVTHAYYTITLWFVSKENGLTCYYVQTNLLSIFHCCGLSH